MHVDVDHLRIDLDKEDDRRMPLEVECAGRARDGVGQDAIFHEAAVHEKVLIAPGAEAQAARDEAARARRSDLPVELLEMLFALASENLNDPFAHRARRREV